MLLPAYLIALGYLIAQVIANTEKTIFVAPENLILGDARPNLLDLHLQTFHSQHSTLRTTVPVAFPNKSSPHGLQSWYLLQDLEQGKRYEVRVCWQATEPTAFSLETYHIANVLETPDLIQDLAAFAEERQTSLVDAGLNDQAKEASTTQSALFLRIWAAADFYTTNQEYMQNPPPVFVDIILDPYILNIFPKSLLPTAVYIILLAIGSWFLSGYAWTRLLGFVEGKQHLE